MSDELRRRSYMNEFGKVSRQAMRKYRGIQSANLEWKGKDRDRKINEDLIRELKYYMDMHVKYFSTPRWVQMIDLIFAVMSFDKDGIEISQPVWQLAYMCLIYILESGDRERDEYVPGSSRDEKWEDLRTHILEKLKPTIAAKKITKFIRSAADRIKAAKIIQKHYKEYLYKPDVYLKSEISKLARTRFYKRNE
jgi:hypothetical protein